MCRRLQHAEAGKRDEGQHEERAGAGSEDAVIEADCRHDRDGEGEDAHAAVLVDVADIRLQPEIDGDRHQQEGQDHLQHVARDHRREQGPENRAQRRKRRHRQLLAEPHMAGARIGERGRARAEQRLQLVGAQRFERRNAGEQHGGNGDHAAAAGNGIDETGEERGEKQEDEKMEGEIDHGGPGRSERKDWPFFCQTVRQKQGPRGALAASGALHAANRFDRPLPLRY